MIFEETFKKLFSIYAFPVNTTGDYSIQELSFGATASGPAKTTDTNAQGKEEDKSVSFNAELAGLSGRQYQNLMRIIRDVAKDKIGYDQGLLMLRTSYGFSEEQAKLLLGVEEESVVV